MAKIVKCIFCEKEIKKAVFGGETKKISLGGVPDLVCCEECYGKYDRSLDGFRFGTKFATIERHTKKKYTEKEIATMYLKYLEEENAQLEKCGNEIPEFSYSFFSYNNKGYFSVREYGQGFLNQDIRAKNMVKSLKKSQDTECCCFDKNDITRIEYYKEGGGDPLGLTKQAFSYGIRLNDETSITYRPCITRTAVIGNGLFFGYRKSAERKIVDELTKFKNYIGSDLPIVKVNKKTI